MQGLSLTRRAALVAITSVIVPRWVHAQDTGDGIEIETPVPPLPTDLAQLETEPALRLFSEGEAVGSQAPTTEERQLGDVVMNKAPWSTEPMKVANYFLQLGTRNDDPGAKFSREWPERANPVIMSFFKATETEPHGDITPWCAAFVNWCIARGNSPTGDITEKELRLTTRSAASGSFRCWDEVEEPQVGDLAVFAQRGTEHRKCSGRGHVAFYLGRHSDGRIRILGGNQILSGTSGAVSIARYPVGGAEKGRLKFLRFVSSPVLRDPTQGLQ